MRTIQIEPLTTILLAHRYLAARNDNDNPVDYKKASTNKNVEALKEHPQRLQALIGYLIKMLKTALIQQREIDAINHEKMYGE